jgi:peptidoglycan/LPS O-acetylase OafA/YrhL
MGTREMMAGPMVLFGWPLASLFAAILIVHLAKTSGSFLHFIFENPVLVFIGRISYGLYLWHYVLLTVLEQQGVPWRYGIYLIPVFAVAILSYYVVERPCLRIKHRFQEVR